MCGITGVLGTSRNKIVDLCHAIYHRGPDAQGTIAFEEIDMALGHTRLSIIDLDPRSNQPFLSECENYAIVFNGEIYNYVSLKIQLESKGYEFKTTSDTEVLLMWLIEYGADRISDLDGMFAFAFYNKKSKTLLLARDHIGEKPLYYSHAGKDFAFCSEIGPLLLLDWIDKRLNMEALKNYLFFLYTPAPDTLYNGIKEVEPGEFKLLKINKMSLTSDYFFRLEECLSTCEKERTEAEDVLLFNKEFSRSVESRLIADVPVGMFLSGGLDSNAIVAKAIELKDTKFDSFTMSYSDDVEAGEYNESGIAKRCADYYGIKNTAINLNNDETFAQSIKETVNMFSQPFGNATCLVSKILSTEVVKQRKVCLVGDGGDELLAGYPRYKALNIYKLFLWLPRPVKLLIANTVELFPESGFAATKIRRIRQFTQFYDRPIAEAYLNWVGYCTMEEIGRALNQPEHTRFYKYLSAIFCKFDSDPIRAASIVDLKSFVPFNLMQSADRTSMQSALELRSPFLAKELVLELLNTSSINKLSKKYNKPLLVKALRNILPEEILAQPKKPFNPPMRSLIRNNIKYIRQFISSDNSMLPNILDRSFIETEISDFEKGKRDNSTFLWGLSTLEEWLRKTYPTGLVVA